MKYSMSQVTVIINEAWNKSCQNLWQKYNWNNYYDFKLNRFFMHILQI